MSTTLRSILRHHRPLSTAINPTLPSHTTIKTLATHRKFSEIETLIESHTQNPNITQEPYLSTLIQSYGVAGMCDHALKLYNQMENLGTPRTCQSFNILLSAYNTSNKNNQVHKLFDEIPQKHGFQPDNISYQILIKSKCEEGEIDSVLLILKEMDNKNIEIDSPTYTLVLDALYKKGRVEEAKKLWEEMTLDVADYNARIGYVVREKGKPGEVLGLINEMTEKGLKPDITTYNYLYKCYSKNGMVEEARRVYQDLEKNGCLPNGTTFRLLVSRLCKYEEFEKAYEVFKVSVKRDKVPDFSVLKKLAEGLVKISMKKQVKELIRVMKEKYPDRIEVVELLEQAGKKTNAVPVGNSRFDVKSFGKLLDESMLHI